MKILMVCLGNICRSPLAEGILQQMANTQNLNWTIHSAGTNGLHNGEAPHRLSQKVATLHGIDISQQHSQKFTKDDINHYDLIFAMANDVMDDIKHIAGSSYDGAKVKLFLNNNTDVPDPWYGGEDGYHKVFAIIEDRCKDIIEAFNIALTQKT
jgi:protein-tyrosine phosphatase